MMLQHRSKQAVQLCREAGSRYHLRISLAVATCAAYRLITGSIHQSRHAAFVVCIDRTSPPCAYLADSLRIRGKALVGARRSNVTEEAGTMQRAANKFRYT